MDSYTQEAGFHLIDSFGLYKSFSLCGKKFDTYYHIHDKEMSLVYMEILERAMFFGKYLNICRIYKK